MIILMKFEITVTQQKKFNKKYYEIFNYYFFLEECKNEIGGIKENIIIYIYLHKESERDKSKYLH